MGPSVALACGCFKTAVPRFDSENVVCVHAGRLTGLVSPASPSGASSLLTLLQGGDPWARPRLPHLNPPISVGPWSYGDLADWLASLWPLGHLHQAVSAVTWGGMGSVPGQPHFLCPPACWEDEEWDLTIPIGRASRAGRPGRNVTARIFGICGIDLVSGALPGTFIFEKSLR